MENFNKKIDEFKNKYPIDSDLVERIPKPKFLYMGDDVLEEAIAAILSGKNILLVGEKATGKNVLAENLAYLFARPMWNISFHVSVDASSLIGDDTLKSGSVTFREGPISLASRYGGFAVLDEINMAKNEAMAVLHSVLDYRRRIDIPGYKLINVHPATRFIATMNYGYEGTRDLNEALLSRFAIIKMPRISDSDLVNLIKTHYPDLKDRYLTDIANFFKDLKDKANAHEISDTAPDLRGIFDGLDLVKEGLEFKEAMRLCLVNKIFDDYEADLIEDLLKARFPDNIYQKDLING
ncbi:AAA family ATPase [Anaerococcus lactolyticus]|uniref:ATPase family associated with various cellular activities (AAA) n=2 Tax=Anaerococcus lactolyticus TaxID=33032 RepID=C2BHM6_9FIRM|nr:MoxR family ATPase [Anaerococcus lactolyticus]EEI85639.1 ATPase family associated with various cellular activities (AAA) [Anaerococcus lactolyticus ATCC 51172]KGF04608.1 nitric-oxide reductase [Anaerococcus lactolyticus S7-1-13]